MLSWKTAACLAAGNTVVIKPAQVGMGRARAAEVMGRHLEGSSQMAIRPLPTPVLVSPQEREVLLMRAGLLWAPQTASLDWSHSSDQKPFSVPCHRALGRGAPARLDTLPHQGLQRQMGAASSRTFGAISGSLALEWIAGLGDRRKLEGPVP